MVALERIKKGQNIVYPNLNKLKRENEEIFAVGEKICQLFSHTYSILVPEDEAGYVVAYLKTLIGQAQEDERITGAVEVIIVSHGKVASSMLEVANCFLGGTNAQALDMELDEDPAIILDKLVQMIKGIDLNNEVLLLVDMGSLTSIGQVLEKITGVKTKVVTRVDTVMVMEAIRLSKFRLLTLDDIVKRIKNMRPAGARVNQGRNVLIYCTTGEGSAKKIKDYLANRLPGIADHCHLRTTGLITQDLNELIENMEAKQDLLCVIGGLKPDRLSDPNKYFSITEILSDEGLSRFKNMASFNIYGAQISDLGFLFSKNLIFIGLQENSTEKIIDHMGRKLFQAGAVKKSFSQAAMEREEWGPTYVGSGVAMPHADTQHVYYSQMALAVLNNPVSWAGNHVEIVCMVALKDLGVQYFKELHHNLMTHVTEIKKANQINIIKHLLTKR